ncbi:hypothetical protein O6H91_23G001200 [Diphasiastrum complanatum]|uniref:Uncharacterized protein n=1 Tax=Diphasiastrum complanatum TaxID=34168 RepID=A0ACC2A7F9_DIPCM|nr:hypothetical protein O6H91_23G001200 [Diphasiastrum complanatum]
MNIITWNVRELNSPIRLSLLQHYLSSLRHSNLVVCLQETKISGFFLHVLTKSFARNFHYSCTSADGTRGGLVTLISRDWRLAAHFSLPGGRANICTISKCGFSFNVVNVYAPNFPLARSDLWNAISLSNSFPLIIAGDFNMYLHSLNGSNRIFFAERLTWTGLVDGFNCSDAIVLCNSPRLHTWSNGRLPPSIRLQDLIDSIYRIMATRLVFLLVLLSPLSRSLTTFWSIFSSCFTLPRLPNAIMFTS